ncbi:MAG: hypothetical protein JO275_07210 [Verrucomicrobia bacterium]|nr:hypothetical protein [Verrucomicrobiota bacterium]
MAAVNIRSCFRQARRWTYCVAIAWLALTTSPGLAQAENTASPIFSYPGEPLPRPKVEAGDVLAGLLAIGTFAAMIVGGIQWRNRVKKTGKWEEPPWDGL